MWVMRMWQFFTTIIQFRIISAHILCKPHESNKVFSASKFFIGQNGENWHAEKRKYKINFMFEFVKNSCKVTAEKFWVNCFDFGKNVDESLQKGEKWVNKKKQLIEWDKWKSTLHAFCECFSALNGKQIMGTKSENNKKILDILCMQSGIRSL